MFQLIAGPCVIESGGVTIQRNIQQEATNSVASIDIAKFICSIFVIAIHTALFEEIPVLSFFTLNFLTRLAVPFFFVASGYFLFGRMEWGGGRLNAERTNRDKFFRFEKRMILFYCAWSAGFLIWTIPNWISIGWWGFPALKDYIVAFFRTGTLYHFWYILASIYGAGMCYLLLRFVGKAAQIAIIATAWIFYLLTYSYTWIDVFALSKILSASSVLGCFQTGALCAMPLMAVGALISQSSRSCYREFKLLLSASLLLAEIICLYTFSPNKSSLSYGFFTIPTAYYLFQWVAYDWRVPHTLARVSPYFRKLSTTIYAVHALIWNFLQLLMGDAFSVFRFCTVTICSVLFALFLEWCKSRFLKTQKNESREKRICFN